MRGPGFYSALKGDISAWRDLSADRLRSEISYSALRLGADFVDDMLGTNIVKDAERVVEGIGRYGEAVRTTALMKKTALDLGL